MTLRRPETVTAGAVLLAASLAAGPVDAGQKALLIGIGEYPWLPPAFQLSGPPNDVRAMREFLVGEWGFSAADIRVLVDGDATKSGILDAMGNWLPEVTKEGDRVVIYYSGHGSQVRDDGGDERDGMDETFVPHDYGRGEAADSDMLRDDEVADALAGLSGRQVVFIADSCHSGTVTRSIGIGAMSTVQDVKPRYLPSRVTTRSIAKGRNEEPVSEEIDVHLTLSAAMPYQLAWEEDGAGIFTRHLIEALTDLKADLNGNGRVTSAEFIDHVAPKTEAWCEQVPQCRDIRFTPNMDPRNGRIVLQPVPSSDVLPAVNEEPASEQDGSEAVSDILPEIADDAVTIEIVPGGRIPIGERVSFSLTSSMDGFVTLLDLNAEGETILLFPTAEDLRNGKSGRIRADSLLLVPDLSYGVAFEATAPAGQGTLMAIVTEDLVEFDSLLDGHRNFEPIEDRLEFVGSITERLRKVWTGDPETNRRARWAVGYANYEVHE